MIHKFYHQSCFNCKYNPTLGSNRYYSAQYSLCKYSSCIYSNKIISGDLFIEIDSSGYISSNNNTATKIHISELKNLNELYKLGKKFIDLTKLYKDNGIMIGMKKVDAGVFFIVKVAKHMLHVQMNNKLKMSPRGDS